MGRLGVARVAGERNLVGAKCGAVARSTRLGVENELCRKNWLKGLAPAGNNLRSRDLRPCRARRGTRRCPCDSRARSASDSRACGESAARWAACVRQRERSMKRRDALQSDLAQCRPRLPRHVADGILPVNDDEVERRVRGEVDAVNFGGELERRGGRVERRLVTNVEDGREDGREAGPRADYVTVVRCSTTRPVDRVTFGWQKAP